MHYSVTTCCLLSYRYIPDINLQFHLSFLDQLTLLHQTTIRLPPVHYNKYIRPIPPVQPARGRKHPLPHPANCTSSTTFRYDVKYLRIIYIIKVLECYCITIKHFDQILKLEYPVEKLVEKGGEGGLQPSSILVQVFTNFIVTCNCTRKDKIW